MPPKLPGSKPHGNQRGPSLRVRLNGGPFVDPETLAIMASWNAAGVSYGVQIDRCVSHAIASGYSPVSDCITLKADVRAPIPLPPGVSEYKPQRGTAARWAHPPSDRDTYTPSTLEKPAVIFSTKKPAARIAPDSGPRLAGAAKLLR